MPELHMVICHVPEEGVDLIPRSLPKGIWPAARPHAAQWWQRAVARCS